MTNKDIRDEFARLRRARPDADMLEIQGASFKVTDDTIFGLPNYDYITRELDWYDSESLNVHDIPGGAPKIWREVADPAGRVNSNYGFLLHSSDNGQQYGHVLAELNRNPASRRAVAIYTRPTMHVDQNAGGRQDFVCTNAVHYFVRDGYLDTVVQMRSNDAIFGFRNDYAWQRTVARDLAVDLRDLGHVVHPGEMIWQVANLHIYPRHFRLVDEYAKTGEYSTPLAQAA